jgi:hypothetical protein
VLGSLSFFERGCPLAQVWTMTVEYLNASAGRATRLGASPADVVAYGAGRSPTVILCAAAGTSKWKSVNGGGGAAIGVRKAAEAAVVTLGALTRVFKYVTSCQRCDSGSEAHDGIAPLLDPWVMNQKTSPSGTLCTRACASAGMFPLPSALAP